MLVKNVGRICTALIFLAQCNTSLGQTMSYQALASNSINTNNYFATPKNKVTSISLYDDVNPTNYRSKLIKSTTMLSATVYGLGVPVALEMKTRQGIGAWLFTTSVGFTVPYFLTKDKIIKETELNYYLNGATRGLLRGYAFAADNKDADDGTKALLIAGTSIGESALKYYIGRKVLNSQNYMAVSAMGDYGTFIGYGIALANHKDELKKLKTDDDKNDVKTFYGLGTLIGGVVGEFAGYKMSSSARYNEGNSTLLRNAHMLSFWFSLSTEIANRETEVEQEYQSQLDQRNGNDSKHAIRENVFFDWNEVNAKFLLTSLPATVVGHIINTNLVLSGREGAMLSTATTAGTLIGFSFALMLEEKEYYTNTYTISSSLGGLTGMGLYLWSRYKINHNKQVKANPGQASKHRIDIIPNVVPSKTSFGSRVTYNPGLTLSLHL